MSFEEKSNKTFIFIVPKRRATVKIAEDYELLKTKGEIVDKLNKMKKLFNNQISLCINDLNIFDKDGERYVAFTINELDETVERIYGRYIASYSVFTEV